MTPARWLTPTGLAWTAAAVTTILGFAAAVLAILGRDVSILLVPALLAGDYEGGHLTRLGTVGGASWRISDMTMMASGGRRGWYQARSG